MKINLVWLLLLLLPCAFSFANEREEFDIASGKSKTSGDALADSLFVKYSDLFCLADSYGESDKHDKAIPLYEEMLEMIPKLKELGGENFNLIEESSLIQSRLGYSTWKCGDYTKAAKILRCAYDFAVGNNASSWAKDQILCSLLEFYKYHMIYSIDNNVGKLDELFSDACAYMNNNLHLEDVFIIVFSDNDFMGKVLSYAAKFNDNQFITICDGFYTVVNNMYKSALKRGSITEDICDKYTGHETWEILAYICADNSLYNEAIELYLSAVNECDNSYIKSMYYCSIGDMYWALNDNINLLRYYILASDEVLDSKGAFAEETLSVINSMFLRFKGVVGFNTSYYSRHRQEYAELKMDYNQCLEIIDIVENFFIELSQKYGVQYLEHINTYGLKQWEEYELSIGEPFQPSAMYLINPLARCYLERALLSLLYDQMNEYEHAVYDFLSYLSKECNLRKTDSLLLDIVILISDILKDNGYFDFSEDLLISCLSENQHESENNEIILTKLINDRYLRNDVVGAHELLKWNAAYILEENEGFEFYRTYWDINNLAKQLFLLARIYKRIGTSNYRECLNALERLIERDCRGVNGKTLSDVHKANVFNFLASEASSYEERIAYYQKAIASAPNQIFIKLNLANLLTISGRFEEADSLLNEISNAINDVSVDSNVKYIIAEAKLNNSVYKHEDDTYKTFAGDVLRFAIEDYKINAKTLITTDLANYWNYYYSELLTTITTAEANFGDCGELSYNAALFQKGVLLRNTQHRKYNILHSADTTLIEALRQFGYEQQHNTDSIAYAERKMMYYYSLHPEFMQGELVPKWDDVRNTLSKDDLAIEISIMNDIEDGTSYYVAILLKNKSRYPTIVKMCKCDELKKLLENTKLKNGYSTVYDEYINHENVLYQLIWAPIEKYLTGVKNIYFAPHDILNFVNLESLHKKEGKKSIAELYNIRRVSTTGNLIKEYSNTYNTATLFGNIDYNYSVSYSPESYSSRPIDNEYSRARGYMSRWKHLAHTSEEIQYINNKLSDLAVKTNSYTGAEGTEEVFKQLSGSNTNIIHLATHGFYFTQDTAAKNDYFINGQMNNNVSSGIRSGVLFSGANITWTGSSIPSNSEDGILNSDEILGMDLSGTDLLVLSACQSALGDIQSDGSYGIQRSFKIAGVNSIIMSLWEVDDEATKIMMTSFYSHLSKGLPIKESFDMAVSEVKKKYREREKQEYGKREIPKSSRYDSAYYWTSFVLLD